MSVIVQYQEQSIQQVCALFARCIGWSVREIIHAYQLEIIFLIKHLNFHISHTVPTYVRTIRFFSETNSDDSMLLVSVRTGKLGYV